MKARPILFSGPMIRALLDGRKTMTRRVIKPQPLWIADPYVPFKTKDCDPKGIIKCPYGKPGDLLWVRETCCAKELSDDEALHYDGDFECPPYGLDGVFYYADSCFQPIKNTPEAADMWGDLYHYRRKRGATVGSIHMPRWASRITLEITDVRVERVQDISCDDARSEGVESDDYLEHEEWAHSVAPVGEGISCTMPTPRAEFERLWDSINNKPGKAWADNPWVWVIVFKVHKMNVDEFPGKAA